MTLSHATFSSSSSRRFVPFRIRYLSITTLVILSLSISLSFGKVSHVEFDPEGIIHVDGKPFFPVGIFTYHLDRTVMAEIHDKQFNTILNGFNPEDLDFIDQQGLKAVCFQDPQWRDAATSHPALLAWYLMDEPESRGADPEALEKQYEDLKRHDPHHPIGVCHFLFESLTKYRESCDFTMTDVYPVTANRDVPLRNVGIHVWEARRVHGGEWPDWAYIQVFGGPETDGGKWAQPLPHEVRCMAFIALVHGATGILYFSYWPQAPDTWNSLRDLNRELHWIAPRLIAPGGDVGVQSSSPGVAARVRTTGKSGVVLIVNMDPVFTTTHISSAALKGVSRLRSLDGREAIVTQGAIREHLGPYEARSYIWGPDPSIAIAGRR